MNFDTNGNYQPKIGKTEKEAKIKKAFLEQTLVRKLQEIRTRTNDKVIQVAAQLATEGKIDESVALIKELMAVRKKEKSQ